MHLWLLHYYHGVSSLKQRLLKTTEDEAYLIQRDIKLSNKCTCVDVWISTDTGKDLLGFVLLQQL